MRFVILKTAAVRRLVRLCRLAARLAGIAGSLIWRISPKSVRLPLPRRWRRRNPLQGAHVPVQARGGAHELLPGKGGISFPMGTQTFPRWRKSTRSAPRPRCLRASATRFGNCGEKQCFAWVHPKFQIPPLRFARAFCYNSLVRLRGGRNRRDAGHDLFHTPGRSTARDRRRRRGMRLSRRGRRGREQADMQAKWLLPAGYKNHARRHP